MKGKRQSTVEPVLGTLTQCMSLCKINTIGLKQANKSMHVSAIAYNFMKYLIIIKKNLVSKSGVYLTYSCRLKCLLRPEIKRLEHFVVQ
ncbi:hypothetical protein ACE939_04465 [Aquimarina sp. W85]|uniref:hypothetical protein n=1 Tax=Aquimarina rhodophyticola TaxID=3342246 RepID=UPI00366F3E75